MSHPDVVIIGSAGMLGRELAAACRRRSMDARLYAGRCELDITDPEQVRRALAGQRAPVVINATGYTDVDGAERQPELADQINRAGAANLAGICRQSRAVLVHYSTDYIFDGRAGRPYRVGDKPNPLNAYGRSKLDGELEITASGCRHLLIRTSWLFAPHGRNFVRTIFDRAKQQTSLDVVDDQHSRPCYAADLADTTLDLLDRSTEGTFHVANDGYCSWFALATAITELARLNCRIRRCATVDFPRPAQRPGFSVLDLSDTVAIVGRPRHWKVALACCLEELTGHQLEQIPMDANHETG